jgi:AcrR family transcriptional regulator
VTDGYGATSIETIARQARVSKRTLYQRYPGKPALFGAVLQRLVARLRPSDSATERLFTGGALAEILTRVAETLLAAALAPEAVALTRMLLAEAGRFPELARIAERQGARHEAVERIAALLVRAAPRRAAAPRGARFAAEQFLQMVIALPQRRALGLGAPMAAAERHDWARDTVALFLSGWRGARGGAAEAGAGPA